MAHDPASRLVIVGAGGHARMCVEILLERDDLHVVGAVSADGTGVPDLGVPIIGTHDELSNITESEDARAVCVAIGDNVVRQAIAEELTQSGHLATLAVSASAVVSPTARLGAGCQVMPAAVITAMARIGPGTIVNTNASVDHDARIGAYVHIAPGVALGGGVTIGDRTLVGLGSRVLPGITIGADVTIGAGAVVIDDIPDGLTVVGVPARPT